jgi:hypothetical protein
MKRYTVTWGASPWNCVTFDCDELPEPLYRHPYVQVQLNRVLSREAVDKALAERNAA